MHSTLANKTGMHVDVGTQRLEGSSWLVLTCLLLGGYTISLQQEQHLDVILILPVLLAGAESDDESEAAKAAADTE